MIEKEFEFYLNNREDLFAKYNGKFLIIKDQEVVGVYDSKIEAYEEGSKLYELGTFLIQQCLNDDEHFTQTFHSRVIFA